MRGLAVGDMSREPSMEDILSSIRKVIARDDAPPRGLNGHGAAHADDEPDVLELSEESDDAVEAIAAPASATLVAADTADAARRSLDALTAAVAVPQAPAIAPATAGAGSRTLDDVVTEALRPLLKQWLDANLPPLVEAMVAKEIARITGRRF
jgi:uncharacterized protein